MPTAWHLQPWPLIQGVEPVALARHCTTLYYSALGNVVTIAQPAPSWRVQLEDFHQPNQ